MLDCRIVYRMGLVANVSIAKTILINTKCKRDFKGLKLTKQWQTQLCNWIGYWFVDCLWPARHISFLKKKSKSVSVCYNYTFI